MSDTSSLVETFEEITVCDNEVKSAQQHLDNTGELQELIESGGVKVLLCQSFSTNLPKSQNEESATNCSDIYDNLTADVFFTQNTAEIDQPEFEKIDRSYICSRFLNIFWIWVVDLKSFEPVHGLSRVVRLIPDKLATAIEINKENLDDPKDDGSFLVDLVTKLLKYYQGQIKEEEITESANQEIFDFLKVVQTLEQKLESFKSLLPDRNAVEIKESAEEILEFSDRINSFCSIYLDFVHPIWIRHQRNNGDFDRAQLEELKVKVTDELVKSEAKLMTEFKSLSTNPEE